MISPERFGPLRPLWLFTRRVVRRFLANKGFLLASAVSYNALLSLIPLLAVLLVALSFVVDQQRLSGMLATEFELLVPGHSQMLTDQLESFLANRHLIGWIGAVVLLFFSSFAFRSLEGAFAVIFPRPKRERHLWISAVIPYAFISVLGLGLLLQTFVVTALEELARSHLTVLEGHLSVADLSQVVVYGLGFIGLVALFTAIYQFMPEIDVRLRRSLVGGLTAACLWELTRQILVWYFTNVSLVNVIYGSFATVVVILLTLETAAIIVLLGAQVIAELERSATESGSSSIARDAY